MWKKKKRSAAIFVVKDPDQILIDKIAEALRVLNISTRLKYSYHSDYVGFINQWSSPQEAASSTVFNIVKDGVNPNLNEGQIQKAVNIIWWK